MNGRRKYNQCCDLQLHAHILFVGFCFVRQQFFLFVDCFVLSINYMNDVRLLLHLLLQRGDGLLLAISRIYADIHNVLLPFAMKEGHSLMQKSAPSVSVTLQYRDAIYTFIS